MFAASLLFQLMTLPIEFDASRRAKAQLESIGLDSKKIAPALAKSCVQRR